AAVTWYLAARYSDRVHRTAMLSVPHPRVFMKNLIMNPAQLRRSWYIFFFQLPWLPEFILRKRDWALLVRLLRNTSPPGVFSNSLPNFVCRKEEVVASSPISTRLPRLVAEHRAASESSRHETQRSIQ